MTEIDNELKEDIEAGLQLLLDTPFRKGFTTRGSIYPFTTENIGGYIKQFNLKNKKTLTVIGSGDHAFNAALMGARNIDCFDINRLAIHHMELKLAGIKTLNLKQFNTFFIGEKSEPFNPETYEKIRDNLSDDSRYFWDCIYEKAIESFPRNIGERIKFSSLFFAQPSKFSNTKDNPYLNLHNFYKLKYIIDDIKFKYIPANLIDLPSILEAKYDLMMLSNISDYIDQLFKKYPLESYCDFIVNELAQHLNTNGKILLAYVYQYQSEEILGKKIINDKYRRNCAFDGVFSTVEVIDRPAEEKDAVYVYTKK